MPLKLAVVGSINLDLVARVESLPRPGETVAGLTFERIPGGKGANQAVAAARLGVEVKMFGAFGSDVFAEEAQAGLREANIEGVYDVGETTGIALIVVDAQGENQIVVIQGANELVSSAPPRGWPVLSQLEIPDEAIRFGSENATIFFLNAAPARPLAADLVDRARVVIVNRYELEALPVEPRLTALTLGAEGAVLLEGGQEVARARAPKIDPVDGTAAGDAFTACLVVSHLEHRPWDEALQRACAAGAIAASRFGAQPSLPTADEVDAILRG